MYLDKTAALYVTVNMKSHKPYII